MIYNREKKPRNFYQYIFMRAFIVLLLSLFVTVNFAHSGTIKGTAKYTAEVPPPSIIDTGKYKKACGSDIRDESLLVEDQGLQNVVISIESEKLGGEPKTYKLDQKGCHYVPHVIAMVKDSELEIHSSDAVNHNIHTYSFENDPINIMFIPGQEPDIQEFEEPEIIKVECDLHHWMKAWIYVTQNSFFGISGPKGAFVIDDVPPGKYNLTAWHEVLGSINQEVTVGEGTAEVIFDFSNITPQVSQK